MLLDITIPNLIWLSSTETNKKIDTKAKVIICSAMGQKAIIMEALKLGVTDFIVKPYFDNLITI